VSEINKFVVSGRLADNPELKYGAKGEPTCTFRLANNVGYGKVKRTNFIPCKVYGKQAEFVAKFFTKGNQILLEAEVNFMSGKNDDGTFWNYTYLFVRQAYFMGAKSDSSDNDQTQKQFSNGNAMPSSPSPYEAAYGNDSDADEEENIPF
jgi:single-strand DNA-binding protein